MSTCSATCEAPGTLAAANEWIELTVRTAGRQLAERRVWCFKPGAVFELPRKLPRHLPHEKWLSFSGFRAGEVIRMTLDPFEAVVMEGVPGGGERAQEGTPHGGSGRNVQPSSP